MRNRRTWVRLLLLIAGLIAIARATFAVEPMAKTGMGVVRGFVDHGIMVFRGIPYGGDPAARRSQPPLPPAPWTGVRECREWATSAPQGEGGEAHGVRRQGEDCLV